MAEARRTEADPTQADSSADAQPPTPRPPEGEQATGAGAGAGEDAKSPRVEQEGGEFIPSPIDPDQPLITPGMNWFVLRVASNKEDSVRETLLRKVKIEGYENLVNRILVPTEKVKVVKGGKQRIQLKKLYPGYVFVEMKLEDDGRIPQDIFFLFKETTGVGDFIGKAGRPAPMSIPEIEKMMLASKPPEEAPTVKMEFQKGEHVKITDGPFENMHGTVDTLYPEQGKVTVIVTIFGRATPIELEYWQIEKAEEE